MKLTNHRPWYYRVLRPHLDFITKTCYTDYKVTGLNNVPENAVVALAANHCNTLMDAMVLVRVDKRPLAFGTRADVFNNPLLSKIFYALRMVPMVRQRDGLRNVLKTKDSIDYIVDGLKNHHQFAIFPEGRHRTKHSLMTFGKGLHRIVIEACEKIDESEPVYIVPVGLEYGDYFRTMSTCHINFGKPINVREIIAETKDLPEAELYREITHRVSEGIKSLITYLPDDEKYDARWALTKAMQAGFKGDLYQKLQANQKTVAKILEADEVHPEKMESLYESVLAFEKKRKKAGVSIYSFRKRSVLDSFLIRTINGIFSLPFYLVSAVMTLPIWLITSLVRSQVKDPAFRNTVNFGVKALLNPIMFFIWVWLAIKAGILLFTVPMAPVAFWLSAAVLLHFVLHIIDPVSFVYKSNKKLLLFLSDIKLMFNGKLKKAYESLIAKAENLI